MDRSPIDEADLCIIGTGPAGAFVGARIAEHGHQVVFLEAGPRFDLEDPNRAAEQLERAVRPTYGPGAVWDTGGDRDAYETDVPVGVEFQLNDLRIKGVGGTSLAWHGTVMRLHERDFRVQTETGLGVDWPLTYDDLRPYYARAERELGVAGAPGPRSPPREQEFPMPPFPISRTDQQYIDACNALDIDVQSVPHARNSEPYAGRNQCEGYGTCVPYCPSGAKYVATNHIDAAEDAGATVIDRAVVTALEHDADRVTGASYRTPDGARHTQRARAFLLACGPIETPRLLLLSTSSTYPDGLANGSGTVGRFFQATPYISTTAIADEPVVPTQAGFDTSMSYEYYPPENPDFNAIWLTFRNENPTSVVERALQGGAPHLRDALFPEINGHPWGDAMAERIEAADLDQFANLRMSSYVEQLPQKDNRVTLSASVEDEFGNPAPKVSFAFSDRVEQTMEFALDIHRDIFTEMGVSITHEETPLQRMGSDHAGTTRMGTDPERSVVDHRGLAHELTNLWVAGPSVFPTSGAVQPVLTVVALALRTAEYLDEALLAND